MDAGLFVFGFFKYFKKKAETSYTLLLPVGFASSYFLWSAFGLGCWLVVVASTS